MDEPAETHLRFELVVSDSRICVVSHYAKFLLGIWFLFLFCKDSEGQWGILLDTSLSLKPMPTHTPRFYSAGTGCPHAPVPILLLLLSVLPSPSP